MPHWETRTNPDANLPGFLALFLAIAAPVLGAGCDSAEVELPVDVVEELVTEITVTRNPSGFAPLTAEIALTTARPVTAEIVVPGREGELTDVRKRFNDPFTQAVLPVLGLYPEVTNTVLLRFFEPDGTLIGELEHEIAAQAITFATPRITIEVADTESMKPGMNLVSYFGQSRSTDAQIPFMFDAAGSIRWYLDYSSHPTLSNLFYDVGVERLANGNLYFGDGSTGQIVEVDMLGHVIRTWPLPGHGFHHNVIEKPNGNFLVTTNKHGLPTIEDHILEIDRESGAIVQVWDLNESLDNRRRSWSTNRRDWFHANGLVYDPADDTIIVSGRVQGTVKLNRNNEVIWILAPHRGWNTSGSGADLSTRLLQPLDSSGIPITDPGVLDGTSNHEEFEWAWYQHAPEMTPRGTLLLFDNGDNRNYGLASGGPYSRAVEYRIDEEAMTVQQVWQYGKERRGSTFAGIVSDVDYHLREDNVVFMPGANHDADGPNGKTIEVDYTTKRVVFEAVIRPSEAMYGITFHRVERLPLYPRQRQSSRD